jgi:hypothetical protein
MIKYIYFNTNEKHWFDVPHKLYKEKIAEPVLWLGDDVHYKKAYKIFGENVVKSLNMVHRPYEFTNIDYEGQNQRFLFSENYYRSKDICLKMMDRLDLYGLFSRLDRESYFHNLVIWTLKKINDSKPEVLLCVESPHDHAKYVIYEICRFLKIPIFKFHTWTTAPLLFLKNMESDEIFNINLNLSSKFDDKANKEIINHVKGVKKSGDKYLPRFMKIHKKNQSLFGQLKNLFIPDYGRPTFFRSMYLDIRHNTGRIIKRKYNPINPNYLGYFLRKRIIFFRRKNLNKAASIVISKKDLSKEYVFFPLHFEPERTSNPDGKEFHDHFIVICKLREFIPSNIAIYIKEHPNQLRSYIKKGLNGRSPLFYKLVKNINNVHFLDYSLDQIDLIKNSKFVVTITGTVALEAAILEKKSLTFGSTYYDGCPNIFKWNKKISYNSLISYKVKSSKLVEEYLLSKKHKTCVLGFQNGSCRSYFKDYDSREFDLYQNEKIFLLLKGFFKSMKLN